MGLEDLEDLENSEEEKSDWTHIEGLVDSCEIAVELRYIVISTILWVGEYVAQFSTQRTPRC